MGRDGALHLLDVFKLHDPLVAEVLRGLGAFTNLDLLVLLHLGGTRLFLLDLLYEGDSLTDGLVLRML